MLRIGERVGNRHLGDAGDGDDVARLRPLDIDALQSLVRRGVGDAARRDRAISETRAMVWPGAMLPRLIRPTAIRPRCES